MMIEGYQPPRSLLERVAAVFGWLSVGFIALFIPAFLLLSTGFGDLREGGELGMLAFGLTLGPALLFGSIWLLLYAIGRHFLAKKSPTRGWSQ